MSNSSSEKINDCFVCFQGDRGAIGVLGAPGIEGSPVRQFLDLLIFKAW